MVGKNLLGDYHELDGTIEFYGRINAILKSSDSMCSTRILAIKNI